MPRKSPPSPQPPRPTHAELAILHILWKRGASSVREVLDALNATRAEPLAYTTVLRFLQIMTEKGHVSRSEGERAHIYVAARPAGRTKRHLVGEFMDRVFHGSVRELLVEALGSRKVSRAELRELRKLLDEYGA